MYPSELQLTKEIPPRRVSIPQKAKKSLRCVPLNSYRQEEIPSKKGKYLSEETKEPLQKEGGVYLRRNERPSRYVPMNSDPQKRNPFEGGGAYLRRITRPSMYVPMNSDQPKRNPFEGEGAYLRRPKDL